MRYSILLVALLCASSFAELTSMKLRNRRHEALRELARHGKRDISTADLSGCISTLFDGLVDIGSPPQQFSLLIDTGSTSLAVAGNNCSTCNGLVTGFYEPGPSATSEGVFTSTLYGDGSSWSGTTYNDVVSIAALPQVNLSFASIESQNDFFSPNCLTAFPSNYQGILGLGYAALASPGCDSYADTVATAGIVDPDIFAIQLCNTEGTLTFGGFDPATTDGEEPVYVSQVLPTGSATFLSYNVNILKVSLGADLVSDGPFGDTIIDSGSTLISLEQAVVDQLAAQLNADVDWPFANIRPAQFLDSSDCPRYDGDVTALNTNLPDLVIQIGDTNNFDLALKPVGSYILPVVANGNTFLCRGVGVANGVNILGYAFMNQYVTIFDRAQTRIGFVKSNCNDSPLPTPTGTVDPDSAGSVAAVSLAVVAAAAISAASAVFA